MCWQLKVRRTRIGINLLRSSQFHGLLVSTVRLLTGIHRYPHISTGSRQVDVWIINSSAAMVKHIRVMLALHRSQFKCRVVP